MGDWQYRDGAWIYDSGSPDADPTVTSMLPVYAARDTDTGPLGLIDSLCEDRHPSELSDEDGVD